MAELEANVDKGAAGNTSGSKLSTPSRPPAALSAAVGGGSGAGTSSGFLPDSPLLTNENTLASGVTVDEDGLQLSTHHSHALGTLRGGRRTQHHSFNDAFQQESFFFLMGRFLDPSATVNDNINDNDNVKNNDTVATELIDTNHPSRSSSSLFSCLEVGFDLFIFFLISSQSTSLFSVL